MNTIDGGDSADVTVAMASTVAVAIRTDDADTMLAHASTVTEAGRLVRFHHAPRWWRTRNPRNQLRNCAVSVVHVTQFITTQKNE